MYHVDRRWQTQLSLHGEVSGSLLTVNAAQWRYSGLECNTSQIHQTFNPKETWSRFLQVDLCDELKIHFKQLYPFLIGGSQWKCTMMNLQRINSDSEELHEPRFHYQYGPVQIGTGTVQISLCFSLGRSRWSVCQAPPSSHYTASHWPPVSAASVLTPVRSMQQTPAHRFRSSSISDLLQRWLTVHYMELSLEGATAELKRGLRWLIWFL